MSTPGQPLDGADPTRGDAPTPDSGAGVTDADALRAAVLDCPGVADLAGAFPPVPGRASGISTTDDTVEIHVVATYGASIQQVGDRIGDAVAPLLAGRSVHVVVDDVRAPDEV